MATNKNKTYYYTTIHGENIASIIPGEDPFGGSGELNPADIYAIVDAMHSNLCNYESDDPSSANYTLIALLGEWMESLSRRYSIE